MLYELIIAWKCTVNELYDLIDIDNAKIIDILHCCVCNVEINSIMDDSMIKIKWECWIKTQIGSRSRKNYYLGKISAP